MPVILPTDRESRPRRTPFATATLLTAIAVLVGLAARGLLGWPEPIRVGAHYLFTPSCKPPKVTSGGRSVLWSGKAGGAWVYYHEGTPVFQLGSLKLVRERFSVRVRTLSPDDVVDSVRLHPTAGRRLISVVLTSSIPPASRRYSGADGRTTHGVGPVL